MNAPVTEITVLTQPDCAFCEQAAAVLARIGRDHPLSVRHIELASEQGSALAAEHRVLFAPGILIDGRMFSFGRLSERRLRCELARRVTHAEPAVGEQGADRR